MKKLIFLPLVFLFTAFMCESDDSLVDAEATIAFPEASPGEIVVEIEGTIISIIPDRVVGIYDEEFCENDLGWFSRVLISGGIYNPDGSSVALFLRHYNSELGNFENLLDELSYLCDSYIGLNSQIRLSMSYYDSEGEFVESYSSDPIAGNSGSLEITELLFSECCYSPMSPEPGDELDGYISGNFEFELTRFSPDPDPDADPIRIRGSFNRVVLKSYYDISYNL